MKGQGKLSAHIIFESVLMLFTQNYQKLSVLVETTTGAFFSGTQCRTARSNVDIALYDIFALLLHQRIKALSEINT